MGIYQPRGITPVSQTVGGSATDARIVTPGIIVNPAGQGQDSQNNWKNDRWSKGGQLLSDDKLKWLEVLLDEAFVIPGTGIRFGIDGIVGLIPWLGDVVAGALSLLIPLAAWVRGVPYVTLVRMLANVSIGLLVGSVPFVGDAFVIWWKANRRNYRLMTRSLVEPRAHSWKDWAFLLAMGALIAAIFVIPLLAFFWIASALLSWHPIRLGSW